MGIFDDTQPAQTVVVAPGRSVRWGGRYYLPGEVITLPTAEAEALALAGFIARPATSQALLTEISAKLQLQLGVSNVDDALSALLLLIQQGAAQPGGGNTPSPTGKLDATDTAETGLLNDLGEM